MDTYSGGRRMTMKLLIDVDDVYDAIHDVMILGFVIFVILKYFGG